jgi:pullulanase
MKNIDVVSDFDIKSLGSFYHPDKTVFRVYAPDYEDMSLVMNGEHYPMNKEEGCFEITVEGDLELARYHYECDGDVSFRDPFSYMSDEKDSYVLDKNKFLKEIYVPKNLDYDPIIYEISIRDFSCDESYTGKYHRKFLSLTESGLKKDGYSIGLDYIKQLGISHLQLMPIFDFDNDKTDYNWGYNPVAYNYVKKDYVFDKDDPYAYVNELRYTINVLHQNDIRVTLDCVFNHVYNVKTNDLGKMLKGKLYRMTSEGKLAAGTLCGSEVDTENPFVHAYILEMIDRYVHLFDVDGIRLDLMGIMGSKTVNMMCESIRRFKPDFIVYGEGWNMGDALPEEFRATIKNAHKMPLIKMFNDSYRETMIHYVSGNDMIDHDVMKYISSENEYLDSSQTINYVECHDDYTFYDRMKIFLQYDDEETVRKRCYLALALVLFSRGIPFVHSGQEFMRTKQGLRNSYNAPEKVNKLDWDLRIDNDEFVKKVIDLIKTRKDNSDFNADGVKVSFKILGRILLYQAGKTCVFFNPSNDDLTYEDGLKHHFIFDENGCCDYIKENVSVSAHCVVICKE